MNSFQFTISCLFMLYLIDTSLTYPNDNNGNIGLSDCEELAAKDGCINEKYLLRAQNKKLVIEFYESVYGNKNFDDSYKYINPHGYIHHPYTLGMDGVDAFHDHLPRVFGNKRDLRVNVDFHLVIADGDLVYLYLNGSQIFEDPPMAIVHIFRVKNNWITESWTISQNTNKLETYDRQNTHPFFADENPKIQDGINLKAHHLMRKEEYEAKETNKIIVKQFYKMVIGGKNLRGINMYMADNVTEHNPFVHDGRESVKFLLGKMFKTNKWLLESTLELISVGAEGDIVFVHQSIPCLGVCASVNMFRLKNGIITEHWRIVHNDAPTYEKKYIINYPPPTYYSGFPQPPQPYYYNSQPPQPYYYNSQPPNPSNQNGIWDRVTNFARSLG